MGWAGSAVPHQWPKLGTAIGAEPAQELPGPAGSCRRNSARIATITSICLGLEPFYFGTKLSRKANKDFGTQ